MFLQNHLIYFIRFPIHSNSLWNKRQSLKEQIAGNSLSVEYWRWPPPPPRDREMLDGCVNPVWPKDKLMHAATSPDVASSNRCRFDQPHRSVNHRHGPLAGPRLTQAHIFWRQKRGNKHIFRSEGSEGSTITKREGENSRGVTEKRDGGDEHERQHREHKTRKGDRKGTMQTTEWDLAGESLAPFDQTVMVFFCKKHMRSQPRRVLQHLTHFLYPKKTSKDGQWAMFGAF